MRKAANLFPREKGGEHAHPVPPASGHLVNINNRSLSRYLLEITACLLAMHLLIQGITFLAPDVHFAGSGRLKNLFDVDQEKNIPSIFSFCLLLAASILLAVIAIITYQRNGRNASLHWWLLCGIFFYLGIDELVEMHEVMAAALRSRFHLTGIFWYAWVIPFGIGLALLFIFFFRFIFHRIPARTRKQFLLAALVYIGGALGMEMLSGWHYTHLGSQGYSWVILTTIEEGMEMIGIILFIQALLEYIHSNFGNIVFHIALPIRKTGLNA